MIAALTWAAAQDRVSVYELLRGLTPTDERRIEAAYAEWRRRAAAGERRHKVDWRTYPLPDEPVPAAPAAAPVEIAAIVLLIQLLLSFKYNNGERQPSAK